MTALIRLERGFCNCGRRVAEMHRMSTRSFALAGCLLALAMTLTTSAKADDGSRRRCSARGRLEAGVLHQEEDGRAARARAVGKGWGGFSQSADCGYGDPSFRYSRHGAMTAILRARAPGRPVGDRRLDTEQAGDVVSSTDPFSGAQQSLEFAKGARGGNACDVREPGQPDDPLLHQRPRRQREVTAEGRRSL